MKTAKKVSWIDRGIAFISPTWGLKRAGARLRLEMANQFRGSDTSRLMSDWLTSSLFISTPLVTELEQLRARSQDLNRNDPVASSITDTLVTNVIGQGLRPQSRIRAELLGISEEEAQKLRRLAESGFAKWAKFADAGNRQDFNGLQALAFRKVVEDGEVLANLPRVGDSWRIIPRAIELVEAERLSTPYGKGGIFQGIELGQKRGEPRRYWIRKANDTQNDFEWPRYEWVGIPARDGQGRPMILHPYIAKRPGQLRGIPFFSSALTYFKNLSDYLSAEVVAAKIAACLAIFITNQDPMVAATAAVGGTDAVSGKGLEFIEPGMINRLRPGEAIQVVEQKRGGETFSSFVEQIMKIIGASVGLPLELVLKDFTRTTYSSARASLLEARRYFNLLRSWFGQSFCQPVWEAVLEELYVAGHFPVRNFYANRTEYCRAQWIGGGWGWVDPTKEVEAAITAINAGLSTHAREISGQGEDWEEMFEQLVQEKAYAKALGLTFTSPGAKAVATSGNVSPEPKKEEPE